jgi:ketosteroid isomerase-like protein
MRAKDWSKVAGFFAADATRMPPNQPMHQGRDAIQLWLSQIDDLTEYTVTLEDIQGAGGIAYVRAKYTINFTLKGMDGPISDTGKAVEIWKKDSEGDWRVASAIWNSDLPLPE